MTTRNSMQVQRSSNRLLTRCNYCCLICKLNDELGLCSNTLLHSTHGHYQHNAKTDTMVFGFGKNQRSALMIKGAIFLPLLFLTKFLLESLEFAMHS